MLVVLFIVGIAALVVIAKAVTAVNSNERREPAERLVALQTEIAKRELNERNAIAQRRNDAHVEAMAEKYRHVTGGKSDWS